MRNSWPGYSRPITDAPSAFETQVVKLGLQPSDTSGQMASTELKDWCSKNRLERFVPETLLNYWKMDVWEKDIVI